MRYMYDSTNIQDDPAGAHMVAYYVDGIFATSVAPVIARFPNAVLVPISAIGTNAGIVGDVEPGCLSPAQGVAWVVMRRATGADPTLYVNETYGWGPLRSLFQQMGVPEPHYWVADYDGIAVVPPGAVAKQYANPTLTHGHFDLSVVADHWPGVDGLYGPGGTLLTGGFGNLTDQEINDQFNFLSQKLSTIGGALQTDVAGLKAQVAAMPASNPVDLAATNSAISVLNAKLDAIAARLQKDLA
jgi:hypothetical protein